MSWFTDLSAQAKRFLVVAAAFMIYLLAFHPLYAVANGAAFMLGVLPVSVSALAYGMRGLLVSFIIVTITNISRSLTLGYVWPEILTLGEFWISSALFLALGIGSSRFNWVRIIASKESAQRKFIESIYQTLVEHSLQGLSIYQNGTFLFVNEPFAKMVGIPLEHFQNSTLLDLGDIIHEDDRAMVFEYANTRQLPGKMPPQHYQFRVIHPDGSTRWLETYQHLITYNGAVAAQGFYLDITEQKQAELALVEERLLLRTLIDTIPSSIFAKDTQHRFVLANTCLADIMLTTPENLIGKSDADFYPEDLAAQFAADETHIMQTGQAKLSYEERLITHDNKPLWSLTSKAPLHNQHGETVGIVGIGQNITETKALEQQLIESELYYQKLVEALPLGILVLRQNTPILINDAGLKILGFSALADFQERYLFEMSHGDEIDRVKTFLQRSQDINRPIHDTQSITRNDGTTLTVEVSHTAIVKQGESATLIIFRDITEQVKQKKESSIIEARYRSLFELSKDAILITTFDGYILDANQAALDLFRTATIQDLRSLNFFEVYHHEGQLEAYFRQLKEQGHASTVVRGKRFKGHEFAISSVIVRGDDAAESYAITNIRDETARAKAERALRDSLAKLNAILTNTHAGIVYSDQTGTIIDCNPAFAALNQMSYEGILGKSVASLTHPDDLDDDRLFLQMTQSGEMTGYEVTKRYLRPDGSIVWVEGYVACLYDEDGNLKNYVGVVQDITERRKAAQALADRENQLRSVLQVAPTGIGVVNHRIFTQVNEQVCEMTGYTEEELIGQNARMIYPSDKAYDYVGQVKYGEIAQTGIGTVETQWQRKDGRLIDVLLRSVPINPDDLSMGVTFTALDITARKRHETQLQSALDEKVVLLQEVHHRVKNNLQVIASLLNLQARTIQDPVILQALQGSRERVYAMAMVHEQLYQSSDLTRINFAEYAQSLITNLLRSYAQQRERVTLVHHIDVVPLAINLAIPLGLITNELISNALIHAFPDKRIGTLTVNFSQLGDLHTLQIIDDGVGLPAGIDPANSPSLGLNLVQNLVQQIKGQVVWEVNNGTSYTITFRSLPQLLAHDTGQQH